MSLKLCALSALLASAALPALAVGSLADITVIERKTGAALPVYSHRGEYWVAGAPGTRYAISVRSKLGQRLMAVPAVDGINVLSGQTAAWHQSGYVFNGYSQYQITGWRKSDSEVAAFEFAAASDSYAGLTGRPANVGVIGVALFREKPQPIMEPQFWPEPKPRARPHDFPEQSSLEKGDAAASVKSRPSAAPSAAPVAEAAAPASRKESSALADVESSSSNSRSAAPLSTPKLGTAHGQRESSVVTSTTFERANAQPDEVVLIRYDSRANLLALGVIQPPRQQPVPNAFPESPTAYVPDPPQRRY
jgi:hypothetical protein